MRKSRLTQLEEKMEALVEGTFARLFAGHLQPRDIALQLARALEDSVAGGGPALRYAVRLNPADAQALLGEQPRLAELLAAELVQAAREAGVTLPHVPEVLILPDPALKARSVTVTAETTAITDTAAAAPYNADAPRDGTGPISAAPRAFLILDGERTVPLSQPIVGLGRRLDNHVILEDARVSRAHAQLRLRFGRYVLYDLGSTGGTYVNGQRVQECVLRPGDVISLAGVLIIYGEDDTNPSAAPPASDAASPPRRPDVPTLPPGRG